MGDLGWGNDDCFTNHSLVAQNSPVVVLWSVHMCWRFGVGWGMTLLWIESCRDFNNRFCSRMLCRNIFPGVA